MSSIQDTHALVERIFDIVDGKLESDSDKVSEIANKWVSLD